MYYEYFQEYELKSEFNKEFVSIFNGWLGKGNLHKLDEISETEWQKFNTLIKLISADYILYLVSSENQTTQEVSDINKVLPNFEASKNKDASQFLKLIIPDLGCVLTEEWDYTYILWHKDNGALEKIKPLITKAELYHWND